MPVKIRTASKDKRAKQQRRTHKNKIKKYEKLIEKQKDSPHMKAWKQKLEHSLSK